MRFEDKLRGIYAINNIVRLLNQVMNFFAIPWNTGRPADVPIIHRLQFAAVHATPTLHSSALADRYCNFRKFRLIFKILSLTDSRRNFTCALTKFSS